MNKKLINVLFIACLSFIFAISLSYAQGKGKGQNKKRPPGWVQGEKKGWQSDIPPGQDKKDGEQKEIRNQSENNRARVKL